MSAQNPLRHAQQRAGMTRFERWIFYMWQFFFSGFILLTLFLLYIAFTIPSFQELENPTKNLATEIYANDQAVLGRWWIENRVPVSYNQLNPNLVKALISTEDERFFSHSGIDFKAIGRVISKTILLGQSHSGGGSTITQQLAKQLYSKRDFDGMSNFRRTLTLIPIKFREWITAVQLERRYTKQEILVLYLNQFNFIHGAYGIKAASEIYFNKNPSELSLLECAVLVGMLKNPALFNPIRRPEKTIGRAHVVLQNMLKQNMISKKDYETAIKEELNLKNFRPATHAEGLAPYCRVELSKEVQRILELPENRKPDGSVYNIYKDGLKIYTTIDTSYQRLAEEAVVQRMYALQKKFYTNWMKKDPWTYRDSETTDYEILERNKGLRDLMRSNKRYYETRLKYLGEISKQLSDRIFHAEVRDIDIERMIEEEAGRDTIRRLLKRRWIDSTTAWKYRKTLKDDIWPRVKSRYYTVQKVADSIMRVPMKMTVFAYHPPTYTKDTTLSPLDSIKYHRMILQAGLCAMDPSTGYIKAWVGGVNFKTFQYDHVTAERQVGSTFKPFVYATAIALQGISPCTILHDVPTSVNPGEGTFRLDEPWTPKNFENYTYGYYTLFEGLKRSINTFSVQLMKQLGDTEPVRGLIHNMGIDSSSKRSNGLLRIMKEPSICLGVSDLTVKEMTGAYATFANQGLYTKPVLVLRITDRNGRLIYQNTPFQRRAISDETAWVMLEMLKYAAKNASGFDGVLTEFGGKTGTTNDASDGWYMGLTPSLVVGTWVGGEDRWIRFIDKNQGQGSQMARPIFAEFLKNIEKSKSIRWDNQKKFTKPAKVNIITDCSQYAGETGYDQVQASGDSTVSRMFEDDFETSPGDTSKNNSSGKSQFDD